MSNLANRSGLSTVPRNRGRVMNAQQVAHEVFDDLVSPEWVRRNLPNKITMGHSTVWWHEFDVIEYIHSCKNVGSYNPPKGGPK